MYPQNVTCSLKKSYINASTPISRESVTLVRWTGKTEANAQHSLLFICLLWLHYLFIHFYFCLFVSSIKRRHLSFHYSTSCCVMIMNIACFSSHSGATDELQRWNKAPYTSYFHMREMMTSHEIPKNQQVLSYFTDDESSKFLLLNFCFT